MLTEVEKQILIELEGIRLRLDRMNAPLEPALTQAAFAKRIRKHPNTIGRWIALKKIRTEKGLIPASELRKYLS